MSKANEDKDAAAAAAAAAAANKPGAGAGENPPTPPVPSPPKAAKAKVRVICEGTLGTKLLVKGDVTSEPEYVAILGNRGQKLVEEVK